MHVESQVWSLVWLFGSVLCGCVWSAVCHNSGWFSACVWLSVCVSPAVRVSSALVVITTMLGAMLDQLVGVVSLC